MSTRKWKIGFIYFLTVLLLFGLSGFIASTMTLESSPPDLQPNKNQTELIRQPDGTSSSRGISQQEEISQQERISQQRGTSQQEGSSQQKDIGKQIDDFPSPIHGTPLRKAETYYSEALQAYLFHAGTDYKAPEGAVIRATHPGTVIFAGGDPILGQKVELDCGDGWSVVYGGLENLRVKEGDKVSTNDILGQIGFYPGADGVADQSQLHYEVWQNDEVQISN
ncbi:MAG: M23 family metallopeptidase [Desulfitobacterium hafniense]|nr:M23 family metallopeptidase [Desulfitobacterium hafniense]